MQNWNDLHGLNVTVMGLGLNGGGLASTLFFAKRGARVTVTDLRDAQTLAPSLAQLKGFDIETVLGEHRERDFADADIVIKNPAVKPDNPYIRLAKNVQTDLSIFLAAVKNPILAVTGSKGKSTTSSALYHILKLHDPRTKIGGNITVSPLSFIDEIEEGAPVVLELSSWQLRDLRESKVLSARVAAVTNLLWDHMNVYSQFEDYAADKAEIFAGQTADAWSIVNVDQDWGKWFADRSPARVAAVGSSAESKVEYDAQFWLAGDEAWGQWTDSKGQKTRQKFFDAELAVPGKPFRSNALTACAMAALWGVDVEEIRTGIRSFPGIEHRLEKFHSWRGIDFYNDTAATIPEASVSSFRSFSSNVVWITGGTDKNLELSAFEALESPPKELIFLHGSATARLIPLVEKKGWKYSGPFSNFQEAVELAVSKAQSGDVVLLSPGAASFEMFKNEFDRGNQFKALVRERARD